MNQLLNSSTVLTGVAPWAAGEFVVADKPVIIKAFGLGPDDLVCVKMIRKVQNGNPNVTATNCEIVLPGGELTVEREYLTDCGVKVCICAKQPWTVVSLSGDYEIEVSGTNVGNKLVTVESDIYYGDNLPSCATQCKVCEQNTASVPVTAVVTGLPCPLVAPFVWTGTTYPSLAAFITDVQTQVPSATYNAATCTFTAPAGSVFPDLVVSAPIVIPPSPPVTAVITPCPEAFPKVWAFDGQTYASITQFKAAVSAFMGVALTYTAATCTFTAPAGSVFPPLALTAVPVIPPSVTYCASLALPDGGFAFQAGDNVDPEATVAMLTCSGGATGLTLYPASGTSAVGIAHTTPVLVCGVQVGYAANKSDCAATVPGNQSSFNGVISGTITTLEVPHVTNSYQNGSVITHYWSNGTTTTEAANCGAWVATGVTRTVSGQYQEQERNTCDEIRWVNATAPVVVSPNGPSLALPAPGGFAFQTGDTIDPLATVAIPLCGGGSMYLYPASGTGHTIAVEICGAIAGYAANTSLVEKPCTCTITVDGIVQVSGSIAITALPIVRTQIANPAAQVVAAFPANGYLVTVFADGTTTTAPLPTQPVSPVTLGAPALSNNGAKMYTNVDSQPSQRAALIAQGWVQINSNSGIYETLLSPTAQVVYGINFSEPYLSNSGSVMGYTPY